MKDMENSKLCLTVGQNSERVILLSRHGESEFNYSGKIGGNSPLSPRGRKYAEALAMYVNSLELPNLKIWTSSLQRTISTAAGVKSNHRRKFHELDELDAGVCEGLSYEEIQEYYPEEFTKRDLDKLRYRYPRGESYEDIMTRVQIIIKELETESGYILIVSHQAVLRCLLTHFLRKAFEEMPYIQVPLHTAIWLTRNENSQWEICAKRLAVDCVDTFRPKPKNCDISRTTTVPDHY